MGEVGGHGPGSGGAPSQVSMVWAGVRQDSGIQRALSAHGLSRRL